MKLLIINGANLDRLGSREPEIYGDLTLLEIQKDTEKKLKDFNISTNWFQSNIEGEIVNAIHKAALDFDGLVINPGGYSHTSVVILDALKICSIPICEVHISQIFKREDFRSQLLTAKGADMIMSGLGKESYYFAALSLKERI